MEQTGRAFDNRRYPGKIGPMENRLEEQFIYPFPVNRVDFIVLQSLLGLVSNRLSNNGNSSIFNDISEMDLFLAAQKLKLTHCMNISYKNTMITGETSLFKSFSRIAEILFNKQKEYWKEVTAKLSMEGVNSLTFKGFYFLSDVYKCREYYPMSDIDLLIEPDSINRFKDILRELGFSQNIAIGSDNKAYALDWNYIEDYEAKHYELYPFINIVEIPELVPYYDFIVKYLHFFPFVFENEKLYYAIMFDVHHNLSHNIALDDIWLNSRQFQVDETTGRAVNDEVLGWFIPARFYHEAMVLCDFNLRLIANLIALVGTRELDYHKILEAAVKYRLQPSLFYCYRFLKEFVGLKIPDDFLEALAQSSSFKESYRDWGDFLPKIFNRRVLFNITSG